MAWFKSSVFGAFLLASGVRAQSDLSLLTCDTSQSGGTYGNSLRTYEILCGKTSDGSSISTSLTSDFTILCNLIDSGPFLTVDGTIDLKTYLATGTNKHTIFAPTDAAFNKIQAVVTALADTKTTDTLYYNSVVASLLQLHILEGTYLTSDLECDKVYETMNLFGTDEKDQFSKTKCRGAANTFAHIGGGNIGEDEQPTVGASNSAFPTSSFTNQVTGSTFSTTQTLAGQFSSNVVGCNGVIHVVDFPLLPGDVAFSPDGGYYTKSGKVGKAGKGKDNKGDKKGKRRELESTPYSAVDDSTRQVDRENRRRRLEALLEPNGSIESTK
eukprot:CAMPEP_0201210486 /NCGR_PEP_ID=MMETSP0851-20130426/180358_1 /ASSEMBLY_ACC=CAM_ASM_000631 /TAXON_ID=183588 /ORGANISM="Pseudo-nitzschia fraudulenta, Strain WWA7" /LENGTH=326 /DNA_ID=CAMNT_0047499291 /DNA_START=65 /DNA_END=1045 /DNA_ORIENTATION=+